MSDRFAISAGTVVTLAGPPISDAVVIVSGGKIEAVIHSSEIPSDLNIEKYPDSILMPGFVNAHTHITLSNFRGVADDRNFVEWLDQIIKLDLINRPDECRQSAIDGVAECFRNGITTIGDNHYLPFARDAMLAGKMKGVNFHEVFGIRTLNLTKGVEKLKKDFLELLKNATSENSYGISPHATYTVPPPVAKMAAEVAKESGVRISTHIAETMDEVQFFRKGEGKLSAISRYVKLPKPDGSRTPLKYFADCGLITDRTLIIHGIFLSDEDVRIAADCGSTIVTCPTSNAKLGCGIPAASAWKNRGITICIATDSPASGDGYNMFEEMRRFVLMQRASTGQSDIFSSSEVIQMVTANSASALGMSGMVGEIKQESCADMILMQPDMNSVSENRDIYNTLLWGCDNTDIVKVWSDGVEVYSRG
jgi:5-methylthioadenosine/S-adenosylhomocysteine deaminase